MLWGQDQPESKLKVQRVGRSMERNCKQSTVQSRSSFSSSLHCGEAALTSHGQHQQKLAKMIHLTKAQQNVIRGRAHCVGGVEVP